MPRKALSPNLEKAAQRQGLDIHALPGTPAFEKLQRFCYQQLEASGFEDIEDESQRLKAHSQRFALNFTPESFEAKAEYFRLAGQFLHEHSFKNDRDRLIWELHSQGLSTREIAAAIAAQKTGKPVGKTQIGIIVRSLSTLMLQKLHDR